MEVTYEKVHKIVEDLSPRIKKDYDPEVIIAIEGGGLLPGLLLRNLLNIPLICVSMKSYQNKKQGKIHTQQWFDDLSFSVIDEKRVIIVDDLIDTGETLKECACKLVKANPESIAIAVLHNKNKIKEGTIKFVRNEHIFIGKQVKDVWITYPWEIHEESETEQDYDEDDDVDIYNDLRVTSMCNLM